MVVTRIVLSNHRLVLSICGARVIIVTEEYAGFV